MRKPLEHFRKEAILHHFINPHALLYLDIANFWKMPNRVWLSGTTLKHHETCMYVLLQYILINNWNRDFLYVNNRTNALIEVSKWIVLLVSQLNAASEFENSLQIGIKYLMHFLHQKQLSPIKFYLPLSGYLLKGNVTRQSVNKQMYPIRQTQTWHLIEPSKIINKIKTNLRLRVSWNLFSTCEIVLFKSFTQQVVRFGRI